MSVVLVNLDDVKSEWLNSSGQFHVRDVADHYGIFEHLYGKHAFFLPRIPMDIKVTSDIQIFSFKI